MRRLLAAVAAAAVVIAVPAPANAAVAGVPLSCSAFAPAYTGSGTLMSYEYTNGGTKTMVERGNGMGFQPTAYHGWGGMGDANWFKTSGYATSPAGVFYSITREGNKTSTGWTVTTTKKAHYSSWGGTRGIALGYDNAGYLYRLGKTSLQRWNLGSGGGLTNYKLVRSDGWGAIRNISFARVVGSGSTRAHVLLANTSDGKLLEFRIPVSNPSAYTARALRTSGWAFRTISIGYCSSGRAIMGITDAGRMAIFHDPSKGDWSGADFRGGYSSVTNWTVKSYSN